MSWDARMLCRTEQLHVIVTSRNQEPKIVSPRFRVQGLFRVRVLEQGSDKRKKHKHYQATPDNRRLQLQMEVSKNRGP